MKAPIVSSIIAILLCSCFAFAQTSPEIQGLNNILAELNRYQADLLFPDTYADFEERVRKLDENHLPVSQSSKQATYIRLRQEMQNWAASCSAVHTFLVNTLNLRTRVSLFEAEEFASEAFLEGDRQLRLAARSYSGQDVDKARQEMALARQYFLAAEIQVIRNHLLGEMRIRIQESKDLKAERFAPKTFSELEERLADLERTVRSETISNEQIYADASSIRHSADRLLYMLQVVNPLFKNPSYSEAFLLSILEPLDKLCAQLDYQPDNGQDVPAIMAQLLVAVQNLQSQNQRLGSRLDSLETQQRELESELTELRDVRARQVFVQQKIDNFQALLKQPVEHIDNKITIQYDSLEFEDRQTELSPRQQQRLQSLVEALRVIPSADIDIRYEIPLIDNNPNFSKDIAGKRVSSIREFLTGDSILPRDDVRTIGQLSADRSSEVSRLTVTLNLTDLIREVGLSDMLPGSKRTIGNRQRTSE